MYDQTLARGLMWHRAMPRAAALSTFTLVSLTAHTALAQAPGTYAPPAPMPAVYAEADPPRRVGIGLRSTGIGVASAADEDHQIKLQGGGRHLRYQFAEHWRAELMVEGAEGEPEHGRYTRASSLATLGVHYLFTPYSSWNWYALLALGGTATEITYANDTTEQFAETHAHLGLGLEYRWDRLSLGAELRAVGLARDDEEGDAPRYVDRDGPVPRESSGAQASLQATFWF